MPIHQSAGQVRPRKVPWLICSVCGQVVQIASIVNHARFCTKERAHGEGSHLSQVEQEDRMPRSDDYVRITITRVFHSQVARHSFTRYIIWWTRCCISFSLRRGRI